MENPSSPKRAKKAKKLHEVARKLPVDLIRQHGGLDTVDLLLFLIIFNVAKKYIVVEALAGCGKTAMLSGLVQRLPEKKAILLLSFTRQAITVARLRAGKHINVQTFDSLFYQTVKHGFVKEMGKDLTEKYTYESFRDLSETLSEEDLQDFVGKTSEMYRLDNIQMIMVDEAQDTPPQALRILETFRQMGKTIVITGDRHQAIFEFMKTENLFDMIEPSQKVTHFLHTTKRCCAEVCSFVNQRFGLGMTPFFQCENGNGPDSINEICVQALYNASLGKIYAKMLFTMNAPMEVMVSEGESTQKFWDAVHHEVSRIYSVNLHKAKHIVEQRRRTLEKKHRAWLQTPREWRLPMFVFSTVHHFKGGECDVTILADDLDIYEKDSENERVKYVAASRARWGILSIRNFTWEGNAVARKRFRLAFLKCRENASRGTPPRVSSVSDLPTTVIPLIASPALDPFTTLFREFLRTNVPDCTLPKIRPELAMKVGSLVDILLGWKIESIARLHNVPEIHVASSEYTAHPLKDRKYARMKKEGLVPPDIHFELKRLIARMKIQATIGRYLVVHKHWPMMSPLIIRASLAKARLQSFVLCGNVGVLERTSLPLAAKIRISQILSSEKLPGILGTPQQWLCVNLQQHMIPNSFFFYRGSYDILIVDRQQTSHIIEVKTVRTIQPNHCLQALLYTIILYVSFGQRFPRRWQTYIYETHRNVLQPLNPEPLLRLASDNPLILPELDHVLYAKLLPEFYNNHLSMDTIVGLL